MSEEQICNIPNETLVVGAIYKSPNLYVAYNDTIRSKYDFSDECCRFYYNCFDIMYRTFSQDFSETNVNVFMLQDKERHKKYKEFGGYTTIDKASQLANEEDFENYFDTLKKYSLLREYERTGFPVRKITEHRKFDLFSAEDIYKLVKTKADKIYTVIGGVDDSVLLGSDASNQIDEWLENPDIGESFPWEFWNYYLRGFRQGELIVEGMLSNEGKTRKMVFLSTFMSFVGGIPVLIMSNEMSKKKLKACQITTILNSPMCQSFFDFKLNKPEREIVTGKYRDDFGEFITRKENESIIDFKQRLLHESTEYRNVQVVAKWIEENTHTYFKYMRDYSDSNIEAEIKKNILSKGIKYAFYDTMKGYKTDEWSVIKQTATRLSEIASDTGVGVYANFQLTDDSAFLDIFDLNSNNLANSKQVFHVLDTLILGKKLKKSEYSKYSIVDTWGGEMPLDMNKEYYGHKFAKSRSEGKDKVTVTEVDLNRNIWTELGLLIKTDSGYPQRTKYNKKE